jgi:hypothetical protein
MSGNLVCNNKFKARGGCFMAEGITYKNEETLFNILRETYKEKSFAAYGIDLPPIKEVPPTNFPSLSADETAMDNLFLLEDGTYVIVVYTASSTRRDKIDYLDYVAKVMEEYFADDALEASLRLIVIYTGDVEQADPVLETGCVTVRAEQAFLVKIDGDAQYQAIKEKIENGQPLTNDDIMKLIILPLTQKGQENKQAMLEKVVGASKKIPDEKLQVMALTGVLAASDKFVDNEYPKSVRRFLSMTKIEKIFEKERIEYGNEKVKDNTMETAKRMLNKGMDIVDNMEITGLTEQEILSLQDDRVVV